MFKKITASFVHAIHNIRAHFFHTILSILGIVIGVAALVAILSLIDGMEQFAKDQISTTTNLKMVVVRTEQFRQVDGLSIKKDSVTTLNFDDYSDLKTRISHRAKPQIFLMSGHEVHLEGEMNKKGARTVGLAYIDTTQQLVAGRKFSEQEATQTTNVAVLTESLARNLSKENIESLIGKRIVLNDLTLSIIGIVKGPGADQNILFYPFTLISAQELSKTPPSFTVEAENIEDVSSLKDEVSIWLGKRFGTHHDFSVVTNELRVEQAARGFQLFRIIMGLIVGISVLVGGIGVMNVLLISVTERTVEIGIRKAVGANRKDFVLQFLSESITVSLLGSIVGLITGILATLVFAPIIKAITKVPFQAAYTWNTFIVVSTLAIVVGVVFGTYPAIRASRLDPVEAIRRE